MPATWSHTGVPARTSASSNSKSGNGTDPYEPATAGEAALYACEEQVNGCFERVGEAGVEEATCATTYRDCIVAAGVPADEPYVVCLDQVIECLGGEDDALCWDTFEGCVDAAYPYEPPQEPEEPEGHEPPDSEYAVCEEPVDGCYLDGGSNVECIGDYRSCLVDEGLAEDNSYIVCLDALIACAGLADASAEPDAELTICADDYSACNGYPEYSE